MHEFHHHLAHELLPVDLGCAVCLQFDVGGRTGGLLSLGWVFRLMIGPLDPVASKLGQQDEWKRTSATKNLTAMDNNNIEKSTDKESECCIKHCNAFIVAGMFVLFNLFESQPYSY